MAPLLTVTDRGLWCPAGDFFVDPWRPVPRAIVTHAHGDHARPGSEAYLCADEGVGLLRRRVGADANVTGVDWSRPIRLGEAEVSFHPAGHVRGSAQVRIEIGGEVWVVSGDYKRAADPSCRPFEVVPCHTFVTEATFALPIYRWDPPATVMDEIRVWWDDNRARGRASVLYGYALGKLQRVLAELALRDAPRVWLHGTVEPWVIAYREAGVAMPPTRRVAEAPRDQDWAGELVLAPPSARGSTWVRRFGPREEAFASGWMRVRRARRGLGYDRGFALSDHVDWPDLLRTIEETGAARVLATHGDARALVRVLRDRGREADLLETAWSGDEGATGDDA